MSDQDKSLLYTAPDGAVKVDVFFKDETVWLTQKEQAELFGVQRPAITKHLGNIFASGELNREATISRMEIVRAEGGREVAREVREAAWPLILPIPSGTLAILSGALLSHLLSGKPKKRNIGDQS